MEAMTVSFSDQSFDEAVRNGLPEGQDLQLIVKEKATVGGNPAVCITFSVQLPDGTICKAQATTTMRNFLISTEVLSKKYGSLLRE